MAHRLHRNRVRAVVATSALLGGGLAGLVLASPAGAATSALSPHGGVLTVLGNSGDNTISVSRDANGAILVNGRHVRIHGVTATVANVKLLRVLSGAGNDTVALDETVGALPQAALFGGTGNDRITGSSAADRLHGGPGDDVLLGGSGNELLFAGRGNDFVDGNQGADTAFLGAGDDVFQWDPGDGSDVVEGQDGTDRMQFNGANIAERFEVSANGPRIRFTRDIGSITMDLDGVETVDVPALGGADTLTVDDVTGTDLTEVNGDLAASGGAGDGAADNVIVNGTAGDDVIDIAGDASRVSASGTAAQVNIAGAESANDRLTVQALAGDDVVEATGLTAAAIRLTEDGGEGDDILLGGAGGDVLLGGAGDDVLLGGPGLDTLDGGPGNNVLLQD